MTSSTKNHPFSIVASDLDGTLLSPNHLLSDFSKQTLKALHDKGFTFIFATGRHHIDVSGIRDTVGIPAYMITSNGARVHDTNNQLMFSENIPPHLIQSIVEIGAQDPDIYIHIYQDDLWLLNQQDMNLKKFHAESGFTYQVFDTQNPPTTGIAKIFFSHPSKNHEYLVTFEDKLKATFGDTLNIAFSTPWCLEVMAADVSKGNALQAVAESLQLTLDNCIAFGDGMNDVELLSMAGKGLVMATSHPKVMAALPNHEVIGSNADDAVAHYLMEHIL
ncbi:sugar/pyridoxal phosphate phosphatase YigL [Vibrio sp. 10N.286.49.B3]|uniref:Cof-type HAD-IIB family hydrolase n=1 Tax=Vibrio sp. 10N.286.49.B3 TaxID=1880855 RepID=UPI000C863E48|nr:Cof-type HAD-IIB family hydrolase [Vibrio sp. 10N.286.49.B3]PMH45448.1 sugar/pyridoxal phosphate phosphatase YigL [Vibrio sp. 10N.286.49.B3]